MNGIVSVGCELLKVFHTFVEVAPEFCEFSPFKHDIPQCGRDVPLGAVYAEGKKDSFRAVMIAKQRREYHEHPRMGLVPFDIDFSDKMGQFSSSRLAFPEVFDRSLSHGKAPKEVEARRDRSRPRRMGSVRARG